MDQHRNFQVREGLLSYLVGGLVAVAVVVSLGVGLWSLWGRSVAALTPMWPHGPG